MQPVVCGRIVYSASLLPLFGEHASSRDGPACLRADGWGPVMAAGSRQRAAGSRQPPGGAKPATQGLLNSLSPLHIHTTLMSKSLSRKARCRRSRRSRRPRCMRPQQRRARAREAAQAGAPAPPRRRERRRPPRPSLCDARTLQQSLLLAGGTSWRLFAVQLRPCEGGGCAGVCVACSSAGRQTRWTFQHGKNRQGTEAGAAPMCWAAAGARDEAGGLAACQLSRWMDARVSGRLSLASMIGRRGAVPGICRQISGFSVYEQACWPSVGACQRPTRSGTFSVTRLNHT